MKRISALRALVVLLTACEIQLGHGQIQRQFPNLFRGSRRNHNNNDNEEPQLKDKEQQRQPSTTYPYYHEEPSREHQPKKNLMVIPVYPMITPPYTAVTAAKNHHDSNITSSLLSSKNDFQQGFMRLSNEVWNQDEIEIQLFPSSHTSSSSSSYNSNHNNEGGLIRLTFQQSPMDQPKPNFFYGTRIRRNEELANNNIRKRHFERDQGDEEEEEEEDNIVPDSISLVQTIVTMSRIPVITGSIHVEGVLYQVRQLPNGDLVVDQRGIDGDFDDEIEIEEDDIGGWQQASAARSSKTAAGSGEGLLQLDDAGGGDDRRYLASSSAASVTAASTPIQHNNSTGMELLSAADKQRVLQNGDDGSELDIMVRKMNWKVRVSSNPYGIS